MPDIPIRNVPQEVLDALERRAAANGRMLNDEILEILRVAVSIPPVRVLDSAARKAEFEEIRAIRDRSALSGRDFGDSAQDQREDRER